ncbi:helix-turn-helix transcriptional regulator [Halomonas ramblicola]|uniref:helix-turn-helix transcriptional regulator n=1 Tax=Halomonas ramblicola TaxID=747349 RepID=UPI0025B56C9A|nr:helix-turn-helix transcriptional regulator [Halomonas ramblicola]MDN3520756.1 helix-turn-helix transcriptional regulator [Halomonas ramblicola]
MPIHDELKRRRQALSLTQEQLAGRIGMTRQQYQRLERGGNPRLDTLIQAADGLNTRLVLVPIEKWHAVKALLEGEPAAGTPLDVDPWQGLLDDEDSDHGR